jgi:hypothetical protein
MGNSSVGMFKKRYTGCIEARLGPFAYLDVVV